jgi:hypothetical protein
MVLRSIVCFVILGCAACSSSPWQSSDAGVDGGATTDASLTFDTSVEGSSDPGVACSNDLHQVLDANGVVVATCPPSQGCANGTCVNACTATQAAKGSLGCDYVVATPSVYAAVRPPCFAMFVANAWGIDAPIMVERAGQSYDLTAFARIAAAGMPETSWGMVPSTGIPPGQVAVLFLSQDPMSSMKAITVADMLCPVGPAISQAYGTAITGSGDGINVTGRGTAWHVTTTIPVTAYDIIPYGGAGSFFPSAELLAPTTSWGTNYLAVVPTRGGGHMATAGAPQWGQLVAMSDGTMVSVYPNVDLPSGTGVDPAPANTTTTYTLSAGEYIQWQESNDMTGTIIQSNQPVAFTGGQDYACYTSTTSATPGCDSTHQQVPPISALGSEYALAPYTTRRSDLQPESIPYRFVGLADGTTLTYDPPVPVAPATLAKGQTVDFETTSAFVVTSQDALHPFYVAQLMTGATVTSGSRAGCSSKALTTQFPPTCTWEVGKCALGDEEFVNTIAPAQFLSSYVFFTDPSYATTNLVFVRKRGSGGFADVTLDCAGTLTGWTPIGFGDNYEMTNIDLARSGMGNGACNNGPHTASSNLAFGVVVWGLDFCSSYAYPAGGNTGVINPIVISPPN